MKLFSFGYYNPGVNWSLAATGAKLERRRQFYFDEVEQRRLRATAENEQNSLAARPGAVYV